jgi:hypothetical protein
MYHKHEVRQPEHALLYLVDCTLATVSHMGMLKTKTKSEFERQIAIAQSGVDWIRAFEIEIPKGSRIAQVIETPTRTVKEWVEKYEE